MLDARYEIKKHVEGICPVAIAYFFKNYKQEVRGQTAPRSPARSQENVWRPPNILFKLFCQPDARPNLCSPEYLLHSTDAHPIEWLPEEVYSKIQIDCIQFFVCRNSSSNEIIVFTLQLIVSVNSSSLDTYEICTIKSFVSFTTEERHSLFVGENN